MRKMLIATFMLLSTTASYAQLSPDDVPKNEGGVPEEVSPNYYLKQQMESSGEHSSVEQVEWDICIEIVSDNEVVSQSEGWTTTTETYTEEEYTVLFSRGRERERMTCYMDQLFIERWTQTN
jgi:hypothetical protein